MSAFLVSKKHIDVLVNAALECKLYGLTRPKELGQMLWDTNMKSVNARYNEKNENLPYTFSIVKVPPTVEVLKAIRCYEYQSCEFEGYEQSEAAKFCRTLTDALVVSLPGYNDAPWMIE